VLLLLFLCCYSCVLFASVLESSTCRVSGMSRHTAGCPSLRGNHYSILPSSDCAPIVSIRYASTGRLRPRCQAYIGTSSAAYAMEEETV
jgi:hypothetical protein